MSHTTALIVLDAQVNMFDEAFPVYGAPALLERISGLIAQAHASRIPIIYVQNAGGLGDPDEPGTPGWHIHPQIAPTVGDVVIQKSTPDAFHETNLQGELKARGVSEVILAGMQTELCIAATCRRAADLGYEVTLVQDGHSTFDFKGQKAAEAIEHYNTELASCARVVPMRELDL